MGNVSGMGFKKTYSRLYIFLFHFFQVLKLFLKLKKYNFIRTSNFVQNGRFVCVSIAEVEDHFFSQEKYSILLNFNNFFSSLNSTLPTISSSSTLSHHQASSQIDSKQSCRFFFCC